jgi:hypothetical protein
VTELKSQNEGKSEGQVTNILRKKMNTEQAHNLEEGQDIYRTQHNEYHLS